MESFFSPAPADVERYRRLRAAGMRLSQKIVETIPRRALNEIGEAIGVLRDGVLEFDRGDMTSVMMDCCLFEWFEDGRNLVQRYAETHAGMPETDESYLLKAYTQAKYRVLAMRSAAPGAGLYCEDIMTGERFFLMDLALSGSLRDGHALATRTIPLGEYYMTGGAGLPVDQEAARKLLQLNVIRNRPDAGPGSIALLIVRACLAAGVADRVAYQTVEETQKKRLREPRWPGSKRRRRPAS